MLSTDAETGGDPHSSAARIDASIARYLSQLDTAGRQGDAVPEARISRLKEETERLNAINAEMMKSEDK